MNPPSVSRRDFLLTSTLALAAAPAAVNRAMAATDSVVDGDTAGMHAYFDRLDPASIGFDGDVFWVDLDGVARARSNYSGTLPDL